MKAPLLKPQDILVLLRILTWKQNREWRYSDLASDLEISQSEIFESIKRAKLSGLFDPLTKKPKRSALKEFILHGLKYAFPAKLGENTVGIPTAHSADPLFKLIISNQNDRYVWAQIGGPEKGIAVSPLYRSVPKAVKNCPELHAYLALIDALRIGKAREREIAKAELEKRISSE